VLSEPSELAPYLATTSPVEPVLPLGVVRPATVGEVQEIVRIAARHRVPLYPISTGKNWGYGDAHPSSAGQVVVDLRRMNAIVKMDETLGLVTVEPGVTQGQLAGYLEERKLPFLAPVTGSSPDCSLIGNALERGFGLTPNADHCDGVMTLEAVLPDGRLYRKFYEERECSDIGRAYKWGIGPYLDGLFFQSNLGIVTRMTIALARRPDHVVYMVCPLKETCAIDEAIPALQNLKATLGDSLPVIKMVSALTPMTAEGLIPSFADNLPYKKLLETIEARRRKSGLSPWYIVAPVHCLPSTASRITKHLRRKLRPWRKPPTFFFSSRRLRWAERLARLFPGETGQRIRRQLSSIRQGLKLGMGIPSEYGLRVAYARQDAPPPADKLDPARHDCGLIWYTPLVPFRQPDVRQCLSMIVEICGRHDIVPFPTITVLSAYCLDITVPLLFDRKNSASRRAAADCYESLLEEGRKRGWLPYRLHVQGMSNLHREPSVFWDVARLAKNAIDPEGLIAPGRYVL
jgi:4-cresol dehydrogenase (hydroxylating)